MFFGGFFCGGGGGAPGGGAGRQRRKKGHFSQLVCSACACVKKNCIDWLEKVRLVVASVGRYDCLHFVHLSLSRSLLQVSQNSFWGCCCKNPKFGWMDVAQLLFTISIILPFRTENFAPCQFFFPPQTSLLLHSRFFFPLLLPRPQISFE